MVHTHDGAMAAEKQINLLSIRLDDITPDMDWDKFYKAKEIFDRHGIKPLLGIVPDNQDSGLKKGEKREDFYFLMKSLEEDGWSISQHGYTHCYETTQSGILGINAFSEFAGLSYEVQLEKIRKGKEILQNYGIHAKIFMAPGHTYDKNTLRALKVSGFTHVTDGYTRQAYIWKGLTFLPSYSAKPKKPKGIDTLCLHTNHMSQNDLEALDQFIEKNRSLVVDFSYFVDNLSGKRRTLWIGMSERIQLHKFKIKRFMGSSTVVQTFFQRTSHPDKKVQMLKRLAGLPVLGIQLLFHKKE